MCLNVSALELHTEIGLGLVLAFLKITVFAVNIHFFLKDFVLFQTESCGQEQKPLNIFDCQRTPCIFI